MRLRSALLVAGIAFLFAGAGASEPGASSIRINEILADPASDWNQDGVVHFRDDEWVEIVNAGTSSVDLDGYRLASADTSWRFGFTGILAPGETRVVYGSESVTWEGAHGASQVGLRLNNTGGTVVLWRLAPGDTVEVDCHTYPDHAAEDDRSTGRVPDGGETWQVFDAHNPYSGNAEPGGSGCFPSPGDPVSCPTPVVRTSWGSLKHRLPDR